MATSRDVLVILTVAVFLPACAALGAPLSSTLTGASPPTQAPAQAPALAPPVVDTTPAPLQIAQANEEEADAQEREDNEQETEEASTPEEKVVSPPVPPVEAKEGAPVSSEGRQVVPGPSRPGGESSGPAPCE